MTACRAFSPARIGRNGKSSRIYDPFGIGCGWTIDVRHAYREILGGEVRLHSTIETYANGWSLNLDFEFIEGEQSSIYFSEQSLRMGYACSTVTANFKIGDTLVERMTCRCGNFILITPKVMIRVYNTSMGNADNAAEFYEVTHP